ncbi:restriction endonuclease [Brevibacterium sediminis]
MAISDWFKAPESDATDPFRRPRPTKAQREAEKAYQALPAFPWDKSMSILLEQHQQFLLAYPDPASEERQAEGFMFEIHTTIGQTAFVDTQDPLGCALLSRPLSFVEPTVNNSTFSAEVSGLLQKYEDNSVSDWPILLLDGHLKAPQSPGQLPLFRPSGSNQHYRVISDYPIMTGARVVALSKMIVLEEQSGPVLVMEVLSVIERTAYYSERVRILPGCSLAESRYFFDLLDRVFYNFRIPGLNYDSWLNLEGDYEYLIKNTCLASDAQRPEWVERDLRYTEVLMSAVAGVRSPGSRQIFEQMQLDGGADYGGSLTLPAPRLVKTPRDAEIYAAEVMEASGFTNVVPTGLGADGGIDVESVEAIAQVKLEGRPSSREQLQRLYGIAAHRDVLALFFSLGGYSAQAIQWAEETGMLLYEFEFDGTIEPRSTLAAKLLNQN